MADEASHDAEELSPTQAAAFGRLLDRLSAEHSFDFREYRVPSLARRVRTRMAQIHVDDFDRYAEYLGAHADEAPVLFDTILINVTGFFRDPEAWQALGREVVPSILADAKLDGTVRVWCAGCSTGEEAYSVALVLAEALGAEGRALDVKIYATDIDHDALAAARQALYRLDQLKDLPEPLLDRYFVREGQLYGVRRELRRWCIFGNHNLAIDPPLSHVDLLVCRNVLIYLKSELQQRLLPRFHYAIRDDGYLFLGKSESLLARSSWFTPVVAKWRIFQRAPHAAARLEVADLRRQAPTAPVSRPEPMRGDPAALDSRRVLEVLASPVFVIDSGDTILAWNEAAAALYEIPSNGALGKEFRDLDISYRAEGLRSRLEDIKSTRRAGRLEDVTFTRRSGEAVQVDIVFAPLLDEHGRVAAVVVSAADVTERVRMRDEIGRLADQHATATEELESTNEELETTNEELQSTNEELETTNEELQSTNEELLTTVDELQAANAELAARTAEARRLGRYQQSIVDSVTEAVIVLDPRFVVTSWNPAAERLWGLRASDAVGRDFFVLPIGNVTAAARDGINSIREGAPSETIVEVRFTVGGAGHVLRLLPLIEDGQVQGVLAMTRQESSEKGPA
ncbi:MAG TPA: CheR family methyltransferase [Methylomirabilota bacterium]|nr:CheR family methyltransferase [Methylomirabilota bacterium]